MNKSNLLKILFIGDVFGDQAVVDLVEFLPKFKIENKIDFTIAQAENVSGRKGFIPTDYAKLKDAGIDAFTIGNHVWAKDSVNKIINNNDVIRPYNVEDVYPGSGSKVFTHNNIKIRVSSFLGITFNELKGAGWLQEQANNFFDAYDQLEKELSDEIHIIDFHAETTSEKNVFALYLDGKVSAVLGTHTHVQTNDERVLPKGTAFISDVGMTGPINCAIGAEYEQVYKMMRFHEKVKFQTSTNPIQFNAVILHFEDNKVKKIEKISQMIK